MQTSLMVTLVMLTGHLQKVSSAEPKTAWRVSNVKMGLMHFMRGYSQQL